MEFRPHDAVLRRARLYRLAAALFLFGGAAMMLSGGLLGISWLLLGGALDAVAGVVIGLHARRLTEQAHDARP